MTPNRNPVHPGVLEIASREIDTLRAANAQLLAALEHARMIVIAADLGPSAESAIQQYDAAIATAKGAIMSSAEQSAVYAQAIMDRDKTIAQLLAALEILVNGFDGVTDCTDLLDGINTIARTAIAKAKGQS